MPDGAAGRGQRVGEDHPHRHRQLRRETYAPLARDPEVQQFVIDQATAAINQNIGIEQLTSDVLDGIKALGTRPAASAALDALKGPATQGIQTVIRNGVTEFVTSQTFAQSWERALR